MVFQCCVHNCRNFSDICNPVGLFRFPKIKVHAGAVKKEFLKRRREAWFNAVRKKGMNIDKLDGYRICSKHFASGQPSHYLDDTNPDWVPHLHMGYFSSETIVAEKREKQKIARYLRRKNRDEKIVVEIDSSIQEEQTAQAVLNKNIDFIEKINISQITESEPEIEVFAPIDIDVDKLATLQAKLFRLQEENAILKTKLNVAMLREEAFFGDNAKITFYTGLPNLDVFNLVLSHVDDALEAIEIETLNNFQKLLLTLMKLRLNTTFTGLSYRFNISVKSASYIFQQVVIILEFTFSYLVHWPAHERISVNIPKCIEEVYGDKVCAIVDCFEIKSQKSSLLKSQLPEYALYKSVHTTKYLIGITPQGFISFISGGWEGKTSDKKITEKCGILDNLKPRDLILSDRGFTVHELVAEKNAELVTAAFIKKKVLEEPKKISNVRIHVERVIGTIRNRYKILNGPVAISLLKLSYQDKPFLDFIVKVCCILNNMCPNVI